MDSLIKYIILLAMFIAAIAGSFAIVFSLGIFSGLFAASLLAFCCLLLFGISAWGMGRGHLKWLRLQNRVEVTGLLLFSLYLGAASLFLGAANTAVEFLNQGEHSASDKVKLFARDILQVPLAEDRETLVRNGVTYLYPLEYRDTVDKVDTLLKEEQKRLQTFFGLKEISPLTVVLHEDYKSIERDTAIPDSAGYYDPQHQSVHFAVVDESWELVFLHEYVHFLSHEYAQKHNVSATRLPQWFEEGMADYFGGENAYWYDLESLETVDFYTLDLNSAFHEASSYSFDPYVQSFLAVDSLVQDFGENTLQQLLTSLSPQRFYTELESITGMDIEEYEATFLEDEIEHSNAIAKLFDKAYMAYEKERYEEARRALEEIVKTGGEYDEDAALWTLIDIHLKLGEYSEAIAMLKEKLETGEEEFRTDDLLFLAEVYLLVDPVQSLKIAEQVKKEAGAELGNEMIGYYYMDPDVLIDAYTDIVSGDEAEGFKLLFDEGLLYNEVVWETLEAQLAGKFPEEF